MAWRHCIVLALLAGVYTAIALGLITSLSEYHHIGTAGKLLQAAGAWFSRPKEATDVQALLPAERPSQPWTYRSLASGSLERSIQLTDTHALVATVSHAVVPGVTSEMMLWWFQNIEGEATYPGDGKVWSKYLMWHPRDHIYQQTISNSECKHPESTKSSQPVLWEICEYILCSQPEGYTTSSFPGAAATTSEQFIKAVAEVKQLDYNGLWVTVPSSTGLGDTFWKLTHSWADTPAGVVINSTQVVGVVEPAWRPIWYARLRNAIVWGLYGKGRHPVVLLQQWLQHCVEEMGNLQYILPSLYAEAKLENAGSIADQGHAQDPPKPASKAQQTRNIEL